MRTATAAAVFAGALAALALISQPAAVSLAAPVPAEAVTSWGAPCWTLTGAQPGPTILVLASDTESGTAPSHALEEIRDWPLTAGRLIAVSATPGQTHSVGQLQALIESAKPAWVLDLRDAPRMVNPASSFPAATLRRRRHRQTLSLRSTSRSWICPGATRLLLWVAHPAWRR